MKNTVELYNRIEALRLQLYDRIEDASILTDKSVIAISQKLDTALNRYNRELKQKSN